VLVAGYIGSATLLFPWVLPLVLLVLLVMWRLNARRSSRLLKHADDYVAAQTSLHQRYEDWVAISRIAALGVDSDKLSARFESDARDTVEHALNISRSTALTRVTYDVAIAVAILVGVPIAWQLETPPAFLAFGLLLVVRVLPRIAGIHRGYQGLVNAVAPIRAIEGLAEALEKEPAIEAGETEPLQWQKLELTNVGVEDAMRASGRRWILRDIDLVLAHGEWLGLTGSTGAGKTTLADVMLTLIRPDAGELGLDGQAVTDALASRWRSQAAYVPQDVVLFDASIRDNLKLYAPDATDAELETMLRRAAADFVFDRLPEGLDTQAGPGGRWLSGGERQRIGIARAMLKNPAFLVLDEPTAALDSDTQATLMEALSKLERAMSVVLITHRPELLELADRVIEIADGSIKP
jgi:ATP-binding cassette subfamily C protein